MTEVSNTQEASYEPYKFHPSLNQGDVIGLLKLIPEGQLTKLTNFLENKELVLKVVGLLQAGGNLTEVAEAFFLNKNIAEAIIQAIKFICILPKFTGNEEGFKQWGAPLNATVNFALAISDFAHGDIQEGINKSLLFSANALMFLNVITKKKFGINHAESGCVYFPIHTQYLITSFLYGSIFNKLSSPEFFVASLITLLSNKKAIDFIKGNSPTLEATLALDHPPSEKIVPDNSKGTER